MFHNSSIKYMIIYLYMRLLDCAGCEWNAILCGWQDMVGGSVTFGWMVHDHNAINYTT